MTPIEILSTTFTLVNGAIVFGQFVLKLGDVDLDTKTCVLLLERVNKDIKAAEDLRRFKYPAKMKGSLQYNRAVDAIQDTKNAAYELGKLVCVSRTGRVQIKGRFKWVMSDR